MLISVTLRITGDLLDPEAVSTILGIIPHSCRRKGDTRVYHSGKEITSKFGLWEWQSKDISKTLTINDHIKRLKNTFKHTYQFLSKLPNQENAWIDVHIVAEDTSENVSNAWFLMDIDAISTLHEIGLPVEFTIDVLPTVETKLS